MECKKLTCVVCPRGCSLTAELEDGKLVRVTGNTCPRGEKYAETELFHAERMLTTTVEVENRTQMLPVRTRTAVPRDALMRCMEKIRTISVQTPVQMGDIIVENLLGTGVDLIASASCD